MLRHTSSFLPALACRARIRHGIGAPFSGSFLLCARRIEAEPRKYAPVARTSPLSGDPNSKRALSGGWTEGMMQGAKTAAANAMMKTFITGSGFDANFQGARIVRMGDAEIEVELDVTERLLNPYKTLHGGATCTLVDLVGTLAIMTQDPTKAGSSVELNVSFLSSAKVGETIVALGRALKVGRKLAFTDVTVTEKVSGRIIATGRHTKAV